MNFDRPPKKDEKKPDIKTPEKAESLDLSAEEMELFELNRAHWQKLLEDTSKAFDSKTGILDILKMTAKGLGEMLSKRGLRIMLNEAKINEIMKKYRKSKEGLVESQMVKGDIKEATKAEEEVDLARENLRKAEEGLINILERQNRDAKSGI